MVISALKKHARSKYEGKNEEKVLAYV